MRRGLIFLLGIMSFLGINTVSADTGTVISHYYDHFEEYVDDYNQYKENIDHLINYWQENYSDIYPYYAVIESLNGGYADSTAPTFSLVMSDSNSAYNTNASISYSSKKTLQYDVTTNQYNYGAVSTPSFIDLNPSSEFYVEQGLLISNGFIYTSDVVYIIPTYVSETLNLTFQEIKLVSGINFPTIMGLYNGTYDYNVDDLPPELNLDNVFSKPLQTLKDLKDTIVNIFTIIAEFIEILPPTMQGMLFTAFSISIILGIIKILL